MQYDEATLRNELALLAQVAEINIHDGIIMEKVIPLYNCVYFVMRFRDTTAFDLHFIDKIMHDFSFCTGLPSVQVPVLSFLQSRQRAPSPLGWYEDQFIWNRQVSTRLAPH